MGPVSIAFVTFLLSGAPPTAAPEMVYGVRDGAIELFTPSDVVQAGASAAASTYRFFRKPTLAVPVVTSAVPVGATGPGYTFTLHPATTYSDGLQAGPFHTVYEGIIHAGTSTRQGLRLALTVTHEFEDGKTLSSTRTLDHLVTFAGGDDIALDNYSSVTALALGDVTADDGSTITITAALLAAPVKITVTGEIQTVDVGTGSRAAGELSSLSGDGTAVAWYQLRDPILAAGGGATPGGGHAFSKAVPKPVAARGAVGSSTEVNRADHVHQAGPQRALATGAPGATVIGAAGDAGVSQNAARGDHAHSIGLPAAPNTAGSDAFLRGQLGSITWQAGTVPPLVNAASAGLCVRADSTGATLEYAACAANPLATQKPTTVTNAASSVGTAKSVSRGDHRHGFGLHVPPAGGTVKNVAAVATQGSSLDYSREDHVHAIGIFSTTKPLVANIASAGSANTVSRGDHRHAAQIIPKVPVPSSTDPKEVGSAGATGTSIDFARGDHAHALDTSLYGSAIKAVGTESSAGVLDKIARVDHVHKGAGGGNALPPFAGAGKHLATNAADDGAEWVEPPPDLSDEVQSAQDDIEALNFLTQDLTAGVPPGQWGDVSDPAVAAIALLSGDPGCSAARGATYADNIASGVAGNYHAVRLPAGAEAANIAIYITGTGGSVFREVVSGHRVLCASADASVNYYVEASPGGRFTSSVTGVKMQSTGGAHLGTSKYQGDPTKVERWALTGNATHIPISKMLPAITGQGGKVLGVNASATGLEWTGTSSGGGADTAEVTYTFVASLRFASVGVPTGSKTLNRTGEAWNYSNRPVRAATISLEGRASYVSCLFVQSGIGAQRCTGRTTGTGGVQYLVNLAATALRTGCDDGISACTKYELTTSSLSGQTTPQTHVVSLYTLDVVGGGGASGPTIPDPTAAGALDYLRVNAAGGAYELADFPAIPAGSTDDPKPAAAKAFRGTSNQWSPSDHVHPLAGADVLNFGIQAAPNFSGGGASGGVECSAAGQSENPDAADCKSFVDAILAGTYAFVAVRVSRFNNNSPGDADAVAVSGCSLFPGVPGATLSDAYVWDGTCYASSADESNNFAQFQAWVRFGNTSPWIRVRLPSYNSHGIRDISVQVMGVR